jgi:uncharacterized protein
MKVKNLTSNNEFSVFEGSKHFDEWFQGTRIYTEYLGDYVQSHSMTWKQKAMILAVASLGLLIPFTLVAVLPMRIFFYCNL